MRHVVANEAQGEYPPTAPRLHPCRGMQREHMEGQHIAGKNFYRPVNEKIAAQYAAKLPKINLFTLDKAFGNWDKASKEHFVDGGIFDQIYTRK